MSDNENENENEVYSSDEETEESENELSEKEEDDEESTTIKKIMTSVEDSDDEEEDVVEDTDEEVEKNNEEDDEEEEEEEDEEEEDMAAATSAKTLEQSGLDDDEESVNDDDDEDLEDEEYLQKFNTVLNKNYLLEYHPECAINNYDEIIALTNVIRDADNNIIDDLHKTLPYLTKYERARILGQRAKQINSGAKVFVKVPENVIDGYVIAQIELEQKRIPFIIRRPIPGGGCEYWNLKDLEMIGF
jgi:DNA-directed RNA polymerase subunit K/omega